ncbi:MAG: hypothetical protein MUF22_09780 [Chitinispirillaceae bacterium]|jgi:hypothetical protein|nr:hypothetical protein [Chitinispirillaceae bacterium]
MRYCLAFFVFLRQFANIIIVDRNEDIHIHGCPRGSINSYRPTAKQKVFNYYPWPDDDKIKDFILTFPIQDSIPRTLVLPEILTAIGKSLRVNFSDPRTGRVYPAFIDSIEIKTDSVIILPSLSLEDCHLTHLPASINKIRTRSLNIGYNYRTLLSLPDELMDLEKPPVYWDSLFVRFDYGAVNSMNSDSVSDTLKAWLRARYK